MQRAIRQVVEFKKCNSDAPGESSGQPSDMEILQLVFLRILKEIDGDLEGLPADQRYRKLSLFANTYGGRQVDSVSILKDSSEIFLDFDLAQRDDESLLDTRILILGGVFEALKSQARRKNRGVYYTPYGLACSISNLSLDALESQERNSKVSGLLDLRILDNACGSGTFLFAMLEELLIRISTRARTIVLDSINVETTKLEVLASYLLRHSLFGHDLDEDAITIAEAQLWLALYGLKGAVPSLIPRANLKVTDTLVSEASNQNYDVVIGNPPYMRLTSGEAQYRQAIKTRYSTSREYNTHALFIQASLSQLKQGGILGYLIHKNLLTLDTFSSLRQSIVETHNLIHLSDCGPGVFRGVTAETAIVVLQKGSRRIPSTITLSSYDSKSDDCGVTSVIDQEDYRNLISSWNNRFLISIPSETMPFLEHMSTLPQLHDFVTIKRGIETGCNRQFISDEPRLKGNWKPLLRGRDIAKYAPRSSVHLNHNLAKLAKPGRKDLQDIP
ncbi:MAG: HsdM family class I SAM-dependent methyltransferase, partial [Candidatus Thorarchaeota archaeon]